MEIQCPGCAGTLDYDGTSDELPCPHCRRTLEAAMAQDGFALVGILAEPPAETGSAVPFDDPIIEDYTHWRGRMVFIMLFGAVCALILIFSIYNGILAYGMHYFHNTKNQIFIGIFIVLSGTCVGGGAWLFRYLGRERARYMDMMGIAPENT